MSKKVQAKAGENSGIKAMSDDELVQSVKSQISNLCVLINEADRRAIVVTFSIRKPPNKLKGGFCVEQCEITRKL